MLLKAVGTETTGFPHFCKRSTIHHRLSCFWKKCRFLEVLAAYGRHQHAPSNEFLWVYDESKNWRCLYIQVPLQFFDESSIFCVIYRGFDLVMVTIWSSSTSISKFRAQNLLNQFWNGKLTNITDYPRSPETLIGYDSSVVESMPGKKTREIDTQPTEVHWHNLPQPNV